MTRAEKVLDLMQSSTNLIIKYKAKHNTMFCGLEPDKEYICIYIELENRLISLRLFFDEIDKEYESKKLAIENLCFSGESEE